jgi:hypothetical protein
MQWAGFGKGNEDAGIIVKDFEAKDPRVSEYLNPRLGLVGVGVEIGGSPLVRAPFLDGDGGHRGVVGAQIGRWDK